MYPANQHLDPYYSHYRDHASYPYYPPPGREAGHPWLATDSLHRVPSCGPWQSSASMSHSPPPEFHSYCNHTYPPGYYSFRPPFPQELPPPHLYYHGPFLHHLNAYPSYFVPPAPYPVDQTPYCYDRFKSHCCGCPNHVCHGGEKSNLKIEEELPEVVKPERVQKGADNSSIIRHPNNQYPVMWLLPGNMKDNGRSFELQPQLFSKWFPESGERSGDVKQQNHDNQKVKQFQWPIVWMPAGYDEPKQEAKELKENDDSRKVTEDPPSPKIKIIPLSWFENGHHDQKPAVKDGSGEHNERSSLMDKSSGTEHQHDTAVDGNFKTSPVVPKRPNNEDKPVGQNYKATSVVPEKEGDDKKVHTCRTIPVMAQKENDEKKSDLGGNKEEKKASNAEKEGENGKRSNVESSKAKHSKLPPVCLRLDPLPRKKSGNASSRSSSPLIRKDTNKDKEDVRETQNQNKETTKPSDPNEEVNVSEVKVKSPDEIDKRTSSRNLTVKDASVKHAQEEQSPTSTVDQKASRNLMVQDASVKHAQEGQISTSMVDQKVQSSVNVEAQENAGVKTLQECDISTKRNEMKMQGEAAKFARRREISLSEPDAALRIQSAYRGYHVRRWQPLEKLRKIKNVHEQMQDVKKQLQGLEDTSKQPTVKEQVAINETIMNLLLKLDTIQGLHPSMRETRKSVARELVCLQEKLDSLCKQLSGEPNHSKNEEEKPERIDNAIQATAHVLTSEPSEEEKFAGVGKEHGLSSIKSKDMMHAEVSSADSTEQKRQMEEPRTTKEEAHDEGKAAAPAECQGSSSTDVVRDIAFSGHSTEQKHQMEESNTILSDVWPEEEKAAAKGEGQEVSSVDYMVSLHDLPFSEESSALKRCLASTEHNSHTEEPNTGVSPAIEDSTTAMDTSSMESGVDGSVEGQVRESAAVKSSVLKHDVVSVEDDPSAPFVRLEDSPVSLKDAEPHENDLVLAADSIVFNPGDQAEEARDANIQKQVMDAKQDSDKETDGTPEPLVGDTNNMEYFTTANCLQSPLLEETSQSDSALEQIVLEQSEATKQCEVSCEDVSALADKQNAENRTGGPAIGEEPLAVPLGNKVETMENAVNVAEPPSNIVAEPTLPESESSELPCEHDGTEMHENLDLKVSSDIQSDGQNECANGTGGVETSEAAECNETPEGAPACATGANSAELEPDNLKDDVGVQMAPEAAVSIPGATHDVPENDNKKKLAEKNQELKEMLQKLLASGNDQMGVIAELSEKVKTLERKLTCKKKPKVRVPRPVRNTTAKAH